MPQDPQHGASDKTESLAGAVLGASCLWLGVLSGNWVAQHWSCGGGEVTCAALLPIAPVMLIVLGITCIISSVARLGKGAQ